MNINDQELLDLYIFLHNDDIHIYEIATNRMFKVNDFRVMFPDIQNDAIQNAMQKNYHSRVYRFVME